MLNIPLAVVIKLGWDEAHIIVFKRILLTKKGKINNLGKVHDFPITPPKDKLVATSEGHELSNKSQTLS